ncbi:o-succinylbenzoate--CoA ligase [Staphylococcus lutrae]|uniref:2-succinylbenzoate--CoA ligase n=1 Tax=Staphylococcus lutrae TaxID=155085 RepID=A0AAC9WIJ9_9STAP|nr:o-succinylbenzoate--CoA ligase [Staphylococcus lutrae]ARJ50073.1 o-succinylbenzoate--CoA ligase [Staphylococcus lutrae]PNZ38355.1 o-succinylbenzoate--CoA ligase [Staphylococcus lutrae]
MEHWLIQQANQHPTKIAIQTCDEKVTFEDLLRRALEIGAALKQLQRSRIGLYVNNSIEAVVLIHGAWLYGIEIALINNRLTAYEIDGQMASIDVDLIISTQPHITLQTSVQVIQSMDLKVAIDAELPQHTGLNEQHIASIMFTSGTTGPQKAVPQTFENHRMSAQACLQTLGFSTESKWLTVLPIYHISGLSILLRSVQYGFTVFLLEKFNTSKVVALLQKEKITHVSLVPVTLMRLMEQGLDQPYHLKSILLGGAKLDGQFIRQALDRQLPIYNSFGMTETCSQFLTANPKMLSESPNTVGCPSRDISLKIVDADENGHGELCIKGGNVMQGYLYPQQMANTFDHEGYFKTGDIASIDDKGRVYIHDRRKDLIISGGENIYPYEIETVAKSHPNIIDAMCTAVKDVQWGQRPILYLVAQQWVNDMEAFLEARLAKYKLPVHIYFVDALPYTSTGKLQRRLLNEG